MNRIFSEARREFTGECLGTFLLVFFGCGVVAASVLTGAPGDLFGIAAVWGFGVAIAILLAGPLSGAHLNPAVTLALAGWQKFPARKIPRYLIAQLVGAFVAAAVLYALFADALAHFEAAHGLLRGTPGSEASARIFGEYFSPAISHGRAFAVEVAGTATLMLVILGLTDPRRRDSRPEWTPWAIGLTVTLLICLFGPLTMACFNPARDLGPRLLSALAGWGARPFRANGAGWFTVYILAPILGAQIGACIHKLFLSPAYASTEQKSE